MRARYARTTGGRRHPRFADDSALAGLDRRLQQAPGRMDPPFRKGDVLGGKYRVERVLGEGGMGVVVAATHLQLQERVALKFLLLDKGSEAVPRFLREAQTAVKIKSEHVARVTDVGTLDGGMPFMVMEYLDGED